MRKFQDISIRHKQMLIIMLTSSVTLLLACAAFVAMDMVSVRNGMALRIFTMAEVLANNSTAAAAVEFFDAEAARESLGALRAETNMVAACLYDRDGRVFATYLRNGEKEPFVFPPAQPAGHAFSRSELRLFQPVVQRGEPLGTILLVSDLGALSERLWIHARIVGLVFVVSLLVAFGLSSRLQRVLSEPILHLARVARMVALEKNYSVRAVKQRGDELGQLTDGFNEMLAQIQERERALQAAGETLEQRVQERTRELEKVHRELVEASRQAGMAEVATSVLHNVGNVLNSVNTSASVIADHMRRSKVSGLTRIATLLGENRADLAGFLTRDGRSEQVIQYLTSLAQHVSSEHSAVLAELGSLTKSIEHIKEIVAVQQSYATRTSMVEIHSVPALVEDALRIHSAALSRNDVRIARQFDPVPDVLVDKHKVMQILVNLISNAKYALTASNAADRVLTLRIAQNGDQMIHIAVGDNGVGIAPENLTRIFSHGFTTRRDGHGFGLHSGFLSAREMGGSLRVQSEGPGKGATVTLALPAAKREEPKS